MTKLKFLIAAAASAMAVAASPASAALTIGDTLRIDYAWPSPNDVIETQFVSYAGAGQTVTAQFGFASVTLFDNRVVFGSTGLCGNCGWSPADFNGPIVRNLTNDAAFAYWVQKSDTVGITSTILEQDRVAVNWQGAWMGSGQVVLGAVPEPTTWAMMIGGFGVVGGALRRRQRVSVRFA